MPTFATVEADIRCPSCNSPVPGHLVGFQWGYCSVPLGSSYVMYRIGEPLLWRLDRRDTVPAWSYFQGGTRGNIGDPTYADLLIREDELFGQKCTNCEHGFVDVGVYIRGGVIREVRAFPEEVATCAVSLLGREGEVIPKPELWDDYHPMDIVDGGEYERLVRHTDLSEKELQSDMHNEMIMEKPTYWEPAPGEGGMTELQHAAYSGDLEGVFAALHNGDDINVQDQSGWTPLHWAADMGMANGEREEVFAALIRAGADLEVRDLEGSTPLLVACRSGNGDLVRQLVAAGANLHAANNKGWTALIEAACYGNPQTVTFLLESGADTTARTMKGETALEKAREYGWEEIGKILSEWQYTR